MLPNIDTIAMRVRNFNIKATSSPYKEILKRELKRLKKREDVLAIGLIGSVARGDTWIGSDLDLEIIIKGDRPMEVVLTEQEVSVDYVYISEKRTKELYPDIVPIYDPEGIMRKAIEELDEKKVMNDLKKRVRFSTELATRYLEKALSSMNSDLNSALCFTHLTGMYSGSSIVLAVTGLSSGRRPVSKLEIVLEKIKRLDLFDSYLSLYGIPHIISKADLLLNEFREGLQEIWGYFKERKVGPTYVLQQYDAEPYFRNRIKPIYEYDKRDFVQVAYAMFPYIMLELFKSVGIDDFPSNVFQESKSFIGSATSWPNRYRRVLELIPEAHIPLLVSSANRFHKEVQALLTEHEGLSVLGGQN